MNKNNILACIFALLTACVYSAEVRCNSSWNFSNYCLSSGNNKKYDKIILTANIDLYSDITLRKNLTITSESGKNYTISVANTRQIEVNPGYSLTLTNVVFDGKNYSGRIEGLFYLKPSSVTNTISRLVLESGATIKGITVRSNANADHAPIHIQKAARLVMNPGSSILDCHNESYHGNGGAICCDSGNIVINGGVIAGCSAKGSGGAIRCTGTRDAAEDHIGLAMRGDIFLYGGYITNNVCGTGVTTANSEECYGGGIYLGETGPMLHVIGPVVVSNNVCKVYDSTQSRIIDEPDDVSTYKLENDHANRLKLSGDKSGLMFTNGWVGVRYPDRRTVSGAEDIQSKRFGGVWEYFTSTHDESRQFFWNGDNRYRGWMTGNALVWTRYNIYSLPADRKKVAELLNEADKDFPLYIEFNDGYIMNKEALDNGQHIQVPDGFEVMFDLQGHSITCDIQVARGGKVTFLDSSTNRSGKVYGYRDVAADIQKGSEDYKNAYCLKGGSYHTEPPPEWVDPDCTLIKNYCEVHPWMVAQLAWETNAVSRVADLTTVTLQHVDNEVREVNSADDLDAITFSAGDWVRNAYVNGECHARVYAVAAEPDGSGAYNEVGDRIRLFDTGLGGIVDSDSVASSGPSNAENGQTFGREDDFTWAAMSYGYIKLIHIAYKVSGNLEITNSVEQAYFKFPDAQFNAVQRKDGSTTLPIKLSDLLLNALKYDRAKGFHEINVNSTLDILDKNGLKKWENLVTGTAADKFLLSTASTSQDGLKLNVSLIEKDNVHATGTGYSVYYRLKKSTESGWVDASDVLTRPETSITLLADNGESVGATGFYRLDTLIVPDEHLSITNEIPSTNIIGVLEIASSFTNTMVASPWVEFSADSTSDVLPSEISLSKLVETDHLHSGDALLAANKGQIYHQWYWSKEQSLWRDSYTVTKNGVEAPIDAGDIKLNKSSAVWVSRKKPQSRSFFLIGQYSSSDASADVAGGGTVAKKVCTLIPNPSISPVAVNDYDWGDKPSSTDTLRIPNDRDVPVILRWDVSKKEWGKLVPNGRNNDWKSDWVIPAGTGFWYHRSVEAPFKINLPQSHPYKGNNR
jgi:hypothetical protein